MSEYSDNSDNFMHSSNTQAVNKNESKATEVSSHMLTTTIGTYHVTLEFSPDNNSQAVEEIRSTLKGKYIKGAYRTGTFVKGFKANDTNFIGALSNYENLYKKASY